MYDSVDSGNDQIEDNLFPANLVSPRQVNRSMKVKSYKETNEGTGVYILALGGSNLIFSQWNWQRSAVGWKHDELTGRANVQKYSVT